MNCSSIHAVLLNAGSNRHYERQCRAVAVRVGAEVSESGEYEELLFSELPSEYVWNFGLRSKPYGECVCQSNWFLTLCELADSRKGTHKFQVSNSHILTSPIHNAVSALIRSNITEPCGISEYDPIRIVRL